MSETQPTTLDALLSRYEKTDGEEYEFTISGGEVFRARALASSVHIEKLERRIKMMLAKCNDPLPPDEWKPYLPVTENAVRDAVYAAELLIEPKLTFLDMLRLSHTCGMVALEIGANLVKNTAGIVIKQEQEEIEDLKND